MESILINTTPQQKQLYAFKKHLGEVFPLPFHMHERYELTLIIKGEGTRIIGDKVNQYKSGDIVLVAPHIPHQWQSSGINETSVSAITLFFGENFPGKEFQSLPEFQGIGNLLELAKFGIELNGELRKNITKELLNLSEEYSIMQIIRILSILSKISQSDEYNLLMDKGFRVSKEQDRERITSLVNYIQDNISKKISIKDLAEVACMHSGSVTRFFKQSTGFALVEYFNLMRISLACQLLSQTNNTILDISHECGFNNMSHFNRYFKRIKGLTPREYRQQLS
jgi:AraC-like DNA-binding protein